MPTLQALPIGEKIFVKGSGKDPYEVRNDSGVIYCSCPAWRTMGGQNDTRACKHILANVDPQYIPHAALVRAGRVKEGVVSTVTAFKDSLKTPEVKKPKPSILLANPWTPEIDPAGWWMSEKLNGVRGYWDGEKFLSRDGNVFYAPDWFRKALPRNVLDGELWMGREKFQATVSAVRKLVPNDTEWKQIQFRVYDAPMAFGSFESRMEFLKTLHASRHDPEVPVWSVLKQERCHSVEHMILYLDDLVSQGAEGVMLRQYGSHYDGSDSGSHSSTLLKVKRFYDAEAEVVGYEKGKGKHKGVVGALQCRMIPEGLEFKVGTGLTDDERRNPPTIGAKITYKYTEKSDKGVPKYASFVAVRDYE